MTCSYCSIKNLLVNPGPCPLPDGPCCEEPNDYVKMVAYNEQVYPSGTVDESIYASVYERNKPTGDIDLLDYLEPEIVRFPDVVKGDQEVLPDVDSEVLPDAD